MSSNPRNDSAAQKFVQLYAEPESLAWAERLNTPSRFSHFVGIPVHGESDNLFRTLRSLSSAAEKSEGITFCAIVVNARASCGAEVRMQNQETLAQLRALSGTSASSKLSVQVLDKTTSGNEFPDDQGVGLARKLVCDLGFCLWQKDRLSSDWLRTTDADALVPLDYFTAESAIPPECSFFNFPYVHLPDADSIVAEAMRLYDLHLLHYVAGLTRAGSPYSFQTIGSVMGIGALPYAQVRGFPKRLAGEDFHLCNKLTKVGASYVAKSQPIQLAGRLSKRVPFGTGAALHKISELLLRGEKYHSYASSSFEMLKSWLRFLEDSSHQAAFDENLLDFEVHRVATELDLISALKRLHGQAASPAARLKHFHNYFDGLQTLRFVRAAERLYHPAEELCTTPF